MLPFLRSGTERGTRRVPLFPLKTVLFPGGRLPLRIFEQRYIDLAKACLRDGVPFGVCLITKGEEVADPAARERSPDFAAIGTLARIDEWDMPQLGILHVTAVGGTRFCVQSHAVQPDGLAVGETTSLAPEPEVALTEAHRPLASLLELFATRIGPQQFPAEHAYDDASWVGYRLAEILPLPLSIKQHMLEINDPEVRLSVLDKFLRQQGLL